MRRRFGRTVREALQEKNIISKLSLEFLGESDYNWNCSKRPEKGGERMPILAKYVQTELLILAIDLYFAGIRCV